MEMWGRYDEDVDKEKILGYKASSEDYLNYLRSKGAKLGRGDICTPQITHILMYSSLGFSKLVMRFGLLSV